MLEKYPLEKGRTMFVFEKNGKIYGHIIRDRTDKGPAQFVFETGKYGSVDELKAEFPPVEVTE